MTYYRLILRRTNPVSFSEIIEQELPDEEMDAFQALNWNSPIIQQNMGGDVHLIALDQQYLECVAVGIGLYQELTHPISEEDTD